MMETFIKICETSSSAVPMPAFSCRNGKYLLARKEKLQRKLYELAEQHELTSKEVVECSQALDVVIAQLQLLNKKCKKHKTRKEGW